MTITVAETPRLANGAERRVYQLLIDQLEPGDLVIPGKRVTDHLKDHEVDFFFVAIEAPGSSASRSRAARSGTTARPGGSSAEATSTGPTPVRQAREACYALRDFIEKDPPVESGPAALGPRRRPAEHRPSRGLRPARVSALEGHRPHRPATMVAKLRDVLLAQKLERPMLTRDGIAQLNEALSGRGLPQRSVVARALEKTKTPQMFSPNTSPSSWTRSS